MEVSVSEAKDRNDEELREREIVEWNVVGCRERKMSAG